MDQESAESTAPVGRILAVSDMHGNLEPVHTLIDAYRPNVLISCGDWGDPGELSVGDFLEITSKVTLLTVFGNHDDIELMKTIRNRDGSPILLENGCMREVNGIRFGGINGIWAKSHKHPWYITDDEVKAAGKLLKGDLVEILLMHGCAIGICDRVPSGHHAGHKSFLDAVSAVKPRVFLCGHLHTQQIKKYMDGRIAANVGHTARGHYMFLEKSADAWSIEPGTLEGEE